MGTLRSRLPDDFQSLVMPKAFVGSDDGDSFPQSLGNNLAIEGISMMQVQCEELKGVIRGKRQNTNIHVFQGQAYGIG